MNCPVCHKNVKMTMREMDRVFLPHPHSEVVLYCPASNKTAREAQAVAKAESENV
jgi:hypothetical protein